LPRLEQGAKAETSRILSYPCFGTGFLFFREGEGMSEKLETEVVQGFNTQDGKGINHLEIGGKRFLVAEDLAAEEETLVAKVKMMEEGARTISFPVDTLSIDGEKKFFTVRISVKWDDYRCVHGVRCYSRGKLMYSTSIWCMSAKMMGLVSRAEKNWPLFFKVEDKYVACLACKAEWLEVFVFDKLILKKPENFEELPSRFSGGHYRFGGIQEERRGLCWTAYTFIKGKPARLYYFKYPGFMWRSVNLAHGREIIDYSQDEKDYT